MTTTPTRLIPTGYCWCGCGGETTLGSFFLSGHDKRAQAALLALSRGSVAALLWARGFDSTPGHTVTDAAVAAGVWVRCVATHCDYAGTPTAVRDHELREHR